MAYLVILNNESDVGEKVMAVAPFEGIVEAQNILGDWAERCIEYVERLDPPFCEYDFEMMCELLADFQVSVEIVEGM